jgi:hypothetical protein
MTPSDHYQTLASMHSTLMAYGVICTPEAYTGAESK